MKKFVRYLNNLVVSFALTVFYVILVGLSSFIFWAVFLLKPKEVLATYWQDANGNAPDQEYFKSAY